MLVILSAETCAAVTVPGHDGTNLALSQIPDIIRHVTGQTSGDLRFNKDSLFMWGLRSGGHQAMDVYSFNDDGSNNHLASASSGAYNPASYNYSQISAVNTSTKLDDRGKLLLFYIDTEQYKQLESTGAFVSTDHSGAASIEYRSRHHDSGPNNGYLIDTKSGIKAKGHDGELVAFLRRNGKTINLNLGNFHVSAQSNQAIAQTNLLSASWSATLTLDDNNVPKMSDGTVYFPVSMVVGDFDNDGYKNEIAVAYSTKSAIGYTVLQITHTGSSPTDANFSISVLKSEIVTTYSYAGSSHKERGTNVDGISCTYSLCTVAGDFDGDGKTEFAVIYRDTSPSNSRYSEFADNYSLFVGYTGKIHVKTYKWNGSGFQTEEYVRVFDLYYRTKDDYNTWNDIDLPLGVKAAVGDFDGDGRDDIAVLRVMLQYTEHYKYFHDGSVQFLYSNFVFGAFVDWYTFDYGSIKPKYNAHNNGPQPWNYGDNRNGWVGIRTTNINMLMFSQRGISETDTSQGNQNKIRQAYYLAPITGDWTPYPVIDREFDIIAGKFTGTVGKVTTRDDLVIKYPQWTSGSGNKLRSHVVLMTNIPGVTNWGAQVHEITSLSDRDHLLAFAKADYLDESLTLGEPVKTVDRSDLDYTAILQMMPYHVDNIKPDGSALTEQPQNFTLLLDTKIDYNNTSTTTDKKSMNYSMTTTAETIFALDSDLTRGASKTFQGIRGITSTFLGETPAGKKIESIGKFWDKMKDTVTTTKSTSNEHENGYIMSIATQANYIDTLYVNAANRYIWRYPLENPPAWILDKTLGSFGSFDASKAERKQTYITFAMSEPSIPTAIKGVNDTHYQPYHESGNLFSYPASLEQVEGYEGHTSLLSGGSNAAKRWEGAAFKETITLIDSTTNQESTKKTNKAGVITKFLSVVDNIFGSSFANIPYDTTSSFTRNVTNKESITVNIPVALSGAQFTAVFEPYLDVTGATTVAFAVEGFRRIDALWGADSLYSKKPDPSFLLPEKFHCTSLPQPTNQYFAAFSGNDNDPTAIRGRGIRYTASEYDMESSNLLMNGVKYKITIPVYNASFVDAKNFKVRLSYAKELKFNAAKTAIGEYTFTTLPGQGNGNHRQFAEFEWTPNLGQGIYYLYAEIDPENAIDEVHENRRNVSGDIIDYGGNNMAYFNIGITNTDSVPFDRTQLETQYAKSSSAGKFAAADLDPADFPYVEWVKVDGLDFRDFIEQKVDGQTQPVPAEVEVKYGGEYLMTDAALIGYALKAESASKDVTEITDSDIGLVFVKKHFAMFPEEDHKLHFRINPNDLENGVGFLLQVYGQEYPLTDIIYGSAGSGSVYSSSSGGCSAGLGLIAGLGVLGLAVMKKRR